VSTEEKEILWKNIAGEIAISRKLKDYTQQTVASHLGVSKQAISNWESARAVPSALDLMKLISLLDMSNRLWPEKDKKKSELYKEIEDLREQLDTLQKEFAEFKAAMKQIF